MQLSITPSIMLSNNAYRKNTLKNQSFQSGRYSSSAVGNPLDSTQKLAQKNVSDFKKGIISAFALFTLAAIPTIAWGMKSIYELITGN